MNIQPYKLEEIKPGLRFWNLPSIHVESCPVEYEVLQLIEPNRDNGYLLVYCRVENLGKKQFEFKSDSFVLYKTALDCVRAEIESFERFYKNTKEHLEKVRGRLEKIQ